ncbi:hypothetical protein HF325_005246 [Metschnikowia pulcherrima]|uniref:Uncharacterized protein n=1 Tax=Metschnikowia pulcherrima TaxID=27326 RepID=A0A8H7GNR2_9ASCO|nr:hypothetical protein HF325_005246 [Metschnikowia pulcherrima]
MQISIITAISTALLVAARPAGKSRASNEITRLTPKSLLGEFAPHARGRGLSNAHSYGGVTRGDEEIKIVLVGNEEKVKAQIKAFLDNDMPDAIKALFIVQDEREKGVLEGLVHASPDDAMNGVRILKFKHAKEIIEGFNVDFDEFVPESPHYEPPPQHENKTDDNYEVVVIQGAKAKYMIEDLVGQDAKIRRIIEALPKDDYRTRELVLQLLGQDDKIQLILSALLLEHPKHQLHWAGFSEVNAAGPNERGQEVNEGLLEKTQNEEPMCAESEKLDEVNDAAGMLQKSFTLLKAFIHDSVFDYRGFELKGAGLELLLQETLIKVVKATACNPKLSDQYKNLLHMFHTMVESIEALRYYQTTDFPGHVPIYNVLDLNVRLLALRNLDGDPDTLTERYVDRVKVGFQFLNLWGAEFRGAGYVPFGRKMVFERQYGQALAQLHELARATTMRRPHENTSGI